MHGSCGARDHHGPAHAQKHGDKMPAHFHFPEQMRRRFNAALVCASAPDLTCVRASCVRVRVRACACDDQTKSVSAPFKSAFEGETPAPGTSTDNTVAKPRTALEAATSDPALEKITVDDAPKLEKKSRTTLRAAAPAPRLPVPVRNTVSASVSASIEG